MMANGKHWVNTYRSMLTVEYLRLIRYESNLANLDWGMHAKRMGDPCSDSGQRGNPERADSKEAIHLTPNGKGWGVETEAPREGGTLGNKPATTNGMGYQGGPVMHANPVYVYLHLVRQLDGRSQGFRQPDDCEPDRATSKSI
jgi:hypothetical protein